MTAEKGPEDPLIGKVVAGCKILSRLGAGGFGVVYGAKDQNTGEPVAIKVMSAQQSQNEDFVKKFLRGAIAAARLDHPNLVGVHRVGKEQASGIHYMVMEYLDGRTLEKILEERGALPPEEVVPMMLQAAEALAAAHRQKIIHRDIKPDNLMIVGDGVVKITDIGLAKTMHGTQRTTKVMGTPHFMPPEQFQGKGMDGRTDIYSLGVTFYYALSKVFPYDGANSMQIVFKILTSEPTSLLDVKPGLPPRLWEIIQKMIRRDMTDRYDTFEDVGKDLRAWEGSRKQA